MKLGIHVPRNNTHVYTKSHNSGLNNQSEMPLFRLGKKNRQVFAFACHALVSFLFNELISELLHSNFKVVQRVHFQVELWLVRHQKSGKLPKF